MRSATSSILKGNILLRLPKSTRIPIYYETICRRNDVVTRSAFHTHSKNAASLANNTSSTQNPTPTEYSLSNDTSKYHKHKQRGIVQDRDVAQTPSQKPSRNSDSRDLDPARQIQEQASSSSSEFQSTTPQWHRSVSKMENQIPDESLEQLKLRSLLDAYQTYGHYYANLDPLNISVPSSHNLDKLDPMYHGFSTTDMDKEFQLEQDVLPCFATDGRRKMKLVDIVAACRSIYTSTMGIEYTHLVDDTQRAWLQERLETGKSTPISRQEKERILEELLQASLFERFEASKFPNDKRYGLDGAEALAPAITTIIDYSADKHGIKDIIVGSCHRGRLTMLPCVYGKSPQAIFAEFQGATASKLLPGMAGDVKYHLGHEGIRTTTDGNHVSLSLLPNPSHLEAIDPVATGKAYATQQLHSKSEDNVMCLALHGDAAFAGQGVAYEILGLSRLPAYNVGGTVRVMVNNQIGFTTNVKSARSTTYCTDLAKYVGAPILHVNADDVEAVVLACKIAADWRARFRTDIFVDLICYRRFGHNELDQPSLTQPEMYAKISAQVPTLEKYIQKLVNEGSFTQEHIDEMKARALERLNEDYHASKNYEPQDYDHPASWNHLQTPEQLYNDVSKPISTGVNEDILGMVGKKLTTFQANFAPHKNLQRVVEARKKNFSSGVVDWSTAEALAFGTLCLERNIVRLTGQDVQRGTFSQRHAVWHDQKLYTTTSPLNDLSVDQAPFVVANSPLGEYGALGFEYGYTLANPNALVMWEAQFGDFTNTAQVIIDNFISSAESKWMQRSGLVLSLPHGYDGQGAEHSSARLERFLALCNEEGRKRPDQFDRQHQDCNMQVAYPTTPANYFHILRRQIYRGYRKPLVILFSKSLLRHAFTRSNITEFIGNSTFQPVIRDQNHNESVDPPQSIKRILLCTGQVYAALSQHRETNKIRDVAITRVEELHPFPWSQIQDNLDDYPNAKDIVWVQEEPYNGGAWSYVRDRFETILERSKYHKEKRIDYVGRATSAVTATGMKKVHEAEVAQLLADAFPSV